MNASQTTQLDALLGLNYGYVALTTIWVGCRNYHVQVCGDSYLQLNTQVYDYILCIPDSVAYIVESQWGLATLPYLACSHLPFGFLLLSMLEVVRPDASSTLCLSYFAVNTYIGILTMFFAECIFVVRAYVVWEKRITGIIIISITAYMIPIVIFFQDMISSVSGECWIPGVIGYLDTTTTTRLLVVYCLLVVAELEILLFLLYPAIKKDGWGIDNRFMRGLIQHNLLYFGCSFGWCSQIE
ncbi:hypothetical protein K503DRAFT_59875 [Rhizopogon vinicolor AM-OR11-026]|uniref:Uncharacterized protein n=1 Tax=Rhizopogon vinicolor AM-OR11-026 TaxID=1314800 RepID=A0A1B7MGF2_9AGAM|nr:hypothetical protein K503DRAFT_59875 [Rhizopogon vinicolor AM-OR11-026]